MPVSGIGWGEDRGHRLVTGVIRSVSAAGAMVEVPAFDDGDDTFGPCPAPLGAVAGDACLVAFDENNQAWISGIAASNGGDLLSRVAALEGRSRAFNVSGVPSLNLGAFDGENITGVRITGNLRTQGTGGNTYLRLRFNGLTGITTQSIAQRVNWDTATANTDTSFAGTTVTKDGIVVAATDWAADFNALMFDGTMFTSGIGGISYRHWLGIYANRDYGVNSDRHLHARIESLWKDLTTPVTSLVLALDAGTFTGRISVETVP